MSRISDIQKKAQELRQKHQNDIEQKVQEDLTKAVQDTRFCLKQRVNIIEADIDNSNSRILSHQSQATTELLQQIEQNAANIKSHQQQGMTELLQQQQEQFTKIKASLKKYNDLSQETAHQINLKKVLFTSNIALISVACIALISSILFGYMAKTNLGELNQVKAELKKEKENLQETQISLEMSKSQFKQKYPELFSKR